MKVVTACLLGTIFLSACGSTQSRCEREYREYSSPRFDTPIGRHMRRGSKMGRQEFIEGCLAYYRNK